jgi:xanthine/CO dehydrogenase XdhC/CoxF family maturation factor
MTWRKASYSGSNGGGCIEVAAIRAAVAVRDSKDPAGPQLSFCPDDWHEFTHQIKNGQLTHS